jgi:toxin ParE1/3/4
MPRVIRSDSAREDLKQIGRHLAKASGSRDVAIRWLAALGERCRLHASQPEMGEPYSDLSGPVRRFSFGSYVVFFHRVPKWHRTTARDPR